MKRLLIIIATVAFMFGDSPVGNWKLSGLRVDYWDIARQPAQVVLYDSYGFGIAVPVADIPAGALFNHTPNGPFTDLELQGAGVNLNVNLYPDGTGVVGEGSYYPDVDIGTNTDGSLDCITTGQIYPITDNFNWETSGGQVDNSFPYVSILGLPSYNAKAGDVAYGLGVNGSSVFDNWTSTPQQIPTPSVLPAITPDGVTMLALGCAGICGSGCDAYGQGCDSGMDYFSCMGACGQQPAAFGAMLPGAWGGYYRQGDDLGASQVDGNTADPEFILEWSAIDGWESESGLGDDLTVDEDGDGTEFDRIFGIPYVSSTYINSANPLCDITGGALTGAGAGLTYPVAGDIVDQLGGEAAVGALVTGLCLEATTATCEDAGGVTELVYGQCLGQVQDGVEDQCDAADLDGDGVGTPVEAVTGLCFDASQSDDFAGACAYYGAATALTITCLQLGFDEETCAAAGEQGIAGVEAYCLYATGGYTCEQAGIAQCDVLTDPTFAFGLCGTLAASLTTSETCDEWAASFSDDFLNETAAQILGMTCSDYAPYYTGIPFGMPEYCAAAADGLFEANTGISCTNYGASYVGMCVESVSGALEMYLMDPSLLTWGMFLTYNAASVQQYQAAGYSIEEIALYFPELLVNDSATDFDPSCYYTGETCGGRLVMDFLPTCVAEVEAHTIVAEFVNLQSGQDCDGTGDVAGGFDDLNGNGVWDEEYEGPAGDGVVNVVDVVKIVGHILGNSPLGGFLLCEADLNSDGIVNVVDVIAVVNIVLGSGLGLGEDDATHATIQYDDAQLSILSNNGGYIGAVDMVVEFDGEFDITLNKAFIGDYVVEDNTAHIVTVGMNNNQRVSIEGTLFTINEGRIASVSAEIANSQEIIEMSYNNDAQPLTFEIKDAYPNPFNPSTTLEMTLDAQADVSVKVYNLTGQLVDVIAEGNYLPNSYKFTWNAENLASGAYFIATQVGNELKNQKVMLIK